MMEQPLPEAYVSGIRDLFRRHGQPDVAQGQMQYMKNQFEFFGLKAPVWTALARQYFEENGIPQGPSLWELARRCFQAPERELHYFALEAVQKQQKKADTTYIDLLEELILTHSWWDTVDWIAKLAGIHFRRFPEQIRPVTERWMASGNIWLQRVSMIFQLAYRDKTDAGLLFEYIQALAGSKEFFIQKGAGWALRQYSRTAPERVRQFLSDNPQLSALTRREGGRLLPENQ
jgi:3-methyladenine DNA glycosylase AlkD